MSDHLASPAAYTPRQRLWRIVAKRHVLAAGSIERPLVFGDNDRPGIMLAGAVRTYLNRFGVAPGRHAVVFSNNDDAARTVSDLAAAGVAVAAMVDAHAAKPGDRVTLGIRPEHLRLGLGLAGTSGVEGRASHVEQLGEASYLYLEVPAVDGFVTVRQEGDTSVGPGEVVSTVLPEQHCHLFDAAGRAFPRLLRDKGVGQTLAAAGAVP